VYPPTFKRRDPEEEESRTEKLWSKARQSSPTKRKEWKVALEPTLLPDCSLDDWFDLFFSDDAVFSLARYQLEHVGDRDVSFHPWRKKKSSNGGGGGDESTGGSAVTADENDGIPELEREISYIHPIGGGSMIGPSEAETFRVQSLKRYGDFGAILRNVTTVGKGIPMGDCFRVEDQWMLEAKAFDGAAAAPCSSLTLSVSFRVVFVKRTMFKGIIQKNTLSETKDWFQGYSKMLLSALESPEHQELRKQRKALPRVPEEQGSPSSYSSLATREVSGRSSVVVSTTKSDSPNSSGSMAGLSAGQRSYRRQISDVSGPGGKFIDGGESNVHKEDATHHTATGSRRSSWVVPAIAFASVVVVVGLLAAVVALWLQVRSVGTSLSVVEGRLGELQTQNTLLLQKLEELTLASTPTKSIHNHNINHHADSGVVDTNESLLN
jgi:hypothetical protein